MVIELEHFGVIELQLPCEPINKNLWLSNSIRACLDHFLLSGQDKINRKRGESAIRVRIMAASALVSQPQTTHRS